MTMQTRSRLATGMAALLASSTLMVFTLDALPAHAQAGGRTVAASESLDFSIPAQPLSSALKAFIRATGWQVGYPAGLTDDRRSRAVSARLMPQAALQNLLAGTGIAIRMTGANTVTLVDARAASTAAPTDGGATVLDTILVQTSRGGVALGTGSVADTGTSVISGGQLPVRAQGNDANGILRNLPNVQYQNDVDDDAGITDQSVIDLRPREVSISGARVYENNFILNGMDINTVTGTQERYGSSDDLDDSLSPPNADRIFGLHSQSVYVPTDFLTRATVIDSNASARYGNFQGGVVSYELRDAAKDRLHGSVSVDYTSSDWAGFELGTVTGLNPSNVAKNEYIKRRSAYELTGPITDNVAVLGQYSRQEAVTQKDRNYRYTESRRVEEDSRNEFYRGQIVADTDYGDFKLEGVYTDYDQIWENADWRNMRMNLAKRGLTSKLQHDYDFTDFSLGGVVFSNVHLSSKLGYGRSSSANDVNGNLARAYKQSYVVSRVVRWQATEQSDWCRTDPSITINTICYDGATGDKDQGQESWNWSQDLTGDVWAGSFALGVDYKHVDAYRRRKEDALYYGAYTSVGESSGVSRFVCNTTEECSEEQFASTKTVYKAFDIEAGLNSFSTYAQLEQTWDWLNVRGGVRVSYDDYMQNLDLAPRFVATVTPFDDFSISLGANRYYDANSLYYAIRDQQPRSQSYTRTRTGAVVGDVWREAVITGNYTNSASNLKTPYNDELTFSLSGKEPLLGGAWRVRLLDRRAKDQFSSETSGTVATLNNKGSGSYQSATAEYSKELDTGSLAALDHLAFNASVTWSKSKVSNESYYEDNLDEEYIWYKGKSYLLGGFDVVTGNKDIPVRFQAGLSSGWFDNTLLVDVAANYNLGYTGVKYTNEDTTVNGKVHEIWADYDFDPTMTVDVAATYIAYEKDDRSLSFNVKVENVFNQTGNATANTDNPWVIGRTVWVGAKAAF